jgi:hypothetical protein
MTGSFEHGMEFLGRLLNINRERNLCAVELLLLIFKMEIFGTRLTCKPHKVLFSMFQDFSEQTEIFIHTPNNIFCYYCSYHHHHHGVEGVRGWVTGYIFDLRDTESKRKTDKMAE